MATDFFERQSVARRNTKWLVVMFVLAVIGIVGTTFVATAIGLGRREGGDVPIEVAARRQCRRAGCSSAAAACSRSPNWPAAARSSPSGSAAGASIRTRPIRSSAGC